MSATCNVQRVATSCLWQCFHNYWLARCKLYTCIHKTTDIIGIKSYAPLTEHFPLQPIYEPRYRPRLANCNRFYYTLRSVKHFQKGYTHYVQMQKEARISKFQRKALPSIIVNVLVTVFQSTSKGILLTDWFASDFLTLRQLRVTTTYSPHSTLPLFVQLRTWVFHGLEAFGCSRLRHGNKATTWHGAHFKLPQIKQIFALWQSVFDFAGKCKVFSFSFSFFCTSFAVLSKTRTHFIDQPRVKLHSYARHRHTCMYDIYIYIHICIYICLQSARHARRI